MSRFQISYTIIVDYKDENLQNPELDEEELLKIFFENQVGNIDSRIVKDYGVEIEVVDEDNIPKKFLE